MAYLIDEDRLDRRVNELIASAKRRNGYTIKQLCSFLEVKAQTLYNKTSEHTLYTLSVRDVEVLKKLAGEQYDL